MISSHHATQIHWITLFFCTLQKLDTELERVWQLIERFVSGNTSPVEGKSDIRPAVLECQREFFVRAKHK